MKGLGSEEDSENEEILVNGRFVSLKRMLSAKTKLSHYCQKFKILYPKYQTSLEEAEMYAVGW